MKIRAGFVSNSSSSSYLVAAVSLWNIQETQPPAAEQLEIFEENGEAKKPQGYWRWKLYDAIRRKVGASPHELLDCYEQAGLHEAGHDTYYIDGVTDDLELFTCDREPSLLGMHIEHLLSNDSTLSQCFQHMQRLIKNDLGVEIPIEEFHMEYGEWGSG